MWKSRFVWFEAALLESMKTTAWVLGLALLAAGVEASEWPQLLGPERDGTYRGEAIRISWGEEIPRILWSVDLGEGFAGPIAVDGMVYVVHREDGENLLDALRIEDGGRVWRASHSTRYRDDFGFNGGPRATPVVAGDRVFTFSAEGILQAVDRATGKGLWRIDTQESFGVEKGFFGVASSPLVVGERVLLNIGGRDGAGVVAFDAATGKVSWQASDHGASYSSPVLRSLEGSRQAIFFTREGLLALDPDSGAVAQQLRWRARIKASVNASSPTLVGDRIFLSSSYGTGAVLLRMNGNGLEEIWRSDRSLTNHYATSIHHDGFLYGFHGRQESGPSLRCVRLETGEVMWSEDRFGAGTLLLAQGHLLILRESGEIISAPASPEGFTPVGRVRISTGEARAYPALAEGIFLARDSRKLVAVDLRVERSGEPTDP